MLNAFPQTVADVELAMRTYLAVLRDHDDVHVSKAVSRYLRGEVPDANPRFAPSCAELAQEVRRVAELDAVREKLASVESKPPVYVLPKNHFQNRWKRGEVEIAGPEARERVRKMIGGGDAQNG